MAISQYESILTNKLKQIIQSEGLVKSGRLLNSIDVKFSEGKLSINAMDYYNELDEEHKLTQQLIDSEEFKKFMVDYADEQINKELK